eukprot:194999_1
MDIGCKIIEKQIIFNAKVLYDIDKDEYNEMKLFVKLCRNLSDELKLQNIISRCEFEEVMFSGCYKQFQFETEEELRKEMNEIIKKEKEERDNNNELIEMQAKEIEELKQKLMEIEGNKEENNENENGNEILNVNNENDYGYNFDNFDNFEDGNGNGWIGNDMNMNMNDINVNNIEMKIDNNMNDVNVINDNIEIKIDNNESDNIEERIGRKRMFNEMDMDMDNDNDMNNDMNNKRQKLNDGSSVIPIDNEFEENKEEKDKIVEELRNRIHELETQLKEKDCKIDEQQKQINELNAKLTRILQIADLC